MEKVRRLWRSWRGGSDATAPRSFWRGRGRLAFVGFGIVVYVLLSPTWPTDQHLRLTLGDSAPDVSEVRVSSTKSESEWAPSKDWDREVTFRYAKGQAPRIVSYEPRLANGDYLVEIELKMDDDRVLVTDRRVALEGRTTTIDLSSSDSIRQKGRRD
jgi:hypothetical protein